MASYTGSPSTLFVRTNGAQSSLYAFSYLDKQDGRKMDSWSRWDFSSELGAIVGMSVVPDGVIVVSLRVSGTKVYTVADYCPLTPGLSNRPYLDSQREWSAVSSGTGSLLTTSGAGFAAAFDTRSTRRFTGSLLPAVPTLLASYPGEPGLVAGALQEASFTMTNPFMRDQKSKAILSGRLTITKVLLAFKESIGFTWNLVYREQVTTTGNFNGRVLGDPSNVVGIEPITTGQKAIPVGRETRDYTLQVSARRWHPLTITAIEWVGQFFNRVQRF